MYCGSCLRDSALAQALLRAGHEVGLIPLYTPLKTEGEDVSAGRVFYGGVKSWLQYASGWFRRMPGVVEWVLDRPGLLKLAGRLGAETPPAKLGAFTLSILKGDEGPQVKELERLVRFLREEVRPAVISVPNLMFIGTARMLGREVGCPVVCELTGEDIFLEAMVEPWRGEAQRIIRERAGDVARFVATSGYYAEKMAAYLGVERSRIEVVYPGVAKDQVRWEEAEKREGVGTVGYFARMCPEKGFDRLVEAFAILRKMKGMEGVRLRAAGYLGAGQRRWLEEVMKRVRREGMGEAVEYVGEVDLAGKLAFFDSVDVVSVPTAYAEAKGLYVLEALARGVAVVQPGHGAFPELIERTGGGELVAAGDAKGLAEKLAELLRDRARLRELGARGRRAVAMGFTDDHMASRMLQVYQEVQHDAERGRELAAIAGRGCV